MPDLHIKSVSRKIAVWAGIYVVCELVLFFALNLSADAALQFEYNSNGKRDPFVPLVGLSGRSMGKTKEILSIDDVDFQGIAKNARGARIVIVNGEMLEEGATLDALEVVHISDKEALVKIRGKEYTLNLYEQENE